MKLTQKERQYLAKRRRLVRRWPVVGVALLIAVGAVLMFLNHRSPLLVNPWETAALLEAERVPAHTLAEMAVKLPIVFLLCCGLLVAMVLFQFAVGANERRLLRLIDRADEGDDTGSVPGDQGDGPRPTPRSRTEPAQGADRPGFIKRTPDEEPED